MFEINLKKTKREEEVGQRKLDGTSAKDYGFIWQRPISQFKNRPNLEKEHKIFIKENTRTISILLCNTFHLGMLRNCNNLTVS